MPPVVGAIGGALGGIGSAIGGAAGAIGSGLGAAGIGGKEILGAGASLLQGMGANDAAKAQAANARAQSEAQQRAYQEMIGKAQGQMDTGETNFLNTANAQSPEMQKAQDALANKASAGYNELKTGLTQGGVRGGQAATQLRRGAGDLQQQLDEMAFKEAQAAKQAKLGYFGNKAQTAQRATIGQQAPIQLQ